MVGFCLRAKRALYALAVMLLVSFMLAPGLASAQTDQAEGPTVVEGDGPRGRIIAFVLQGEASALNEAELRRSIDEIVDDVFGETSAFNRDNSPALNQERQAIVQRTNSAFRLAPNAEPLLFRVFDVPVLVVQAAQALPRQEFAMHWQDRRQFPDASTVLDQHQAHSIIFALIDPDETQQQVRAAEAVSAVAAAFSKSDNTLGVHWAEADMALTPDSLVTAFEQASAEAAKAADANLPIKPAWHRLLTLWINILPADAAAFLGAYIAAINGPVPRDVPPDAIGFLTKGLVSFIGREIEMAPSGRPTAEQALALVNLLAYLLDQGQVLNDSDTLGFSEERSIEARLLDAGKMPGYEQTPILRLSYTVDEAAGEGQPAQ